MNWSSEYYHSIDIVLAVCNGEKYLAEQLISLRKNIDYDFLVRKVIVVDDASTDQTIAILSKEALIDSKLEIYSLNSKRVGAAENFSKGAELTRASFVMFCDQDDVWFETKIIESLSTMIQEDSNKPKLVFSDLHVVNDQLGMICPSYFTLKKIKPDWHENLDNLIKQNVVSGCTMMVNRFLLNKALPVPYEAYMHDWWLALIAKIEGRIIFINKPLMHYRQHENNTIGAKHKNKFHLALRVKNFVFSVDKTILQAQKILALYPDLSQSKNEILTISKLPSHSFLTKIGLFLQGGCRRSSFLGSCAMLFYLIFFAKTWKDRN